MNATFYNFSKRVNSTKVPDANVSGTTYNVVYKMPTSRRNPTIRINADTFDFNYCLLDGKYYFVTDIVSVRNDLWDVNLSIDVLGTYRAQILATTAYVLYDTGGDPEIVDTRLQIKSDFTISAADTEMPQMEGGGVYALTAIGKSSTDSWILDSTSQLTNLLEQEWSGIFNPQVQPTLPGIPEQIKASIDYIVEVIGQLFSSGNAPQCIRACYWIPWDITGDETDTIYLGNFNTGVSGLRVKRNSVTYSFTVNIPWQCNDWRRNSPYTQVYLYLPFIGLVNIPTAAITKWSSMSVQYSISKRTGELSVMVHTGNQIVGIYQGNSAINIPLGQSNVPTAQRTTALIETVTSAAAMAFGGIGVPVGAASLAGVAGNLAGIMAGSPSCIGSASGGTDASLPRMIRCFTVFHDTNVTPASVSSAIGLPAFRSESLGSISGYCQCHEASVQGVAMLDDYEAINNYLNTGVFIE